MAYERQRDFVFYGIKRHRGAELWKSDGTAAGTVMVKDIFPGGFSSYPNSLVNLNGTLYFSADEDIAGNELWRSDGTDAGTTLVKRISTEGLSYGPNSLTNFNGTLLFTANDNIAGYELWKSDGAEAGTAMLKNIDSVDQPSFPDNLVHMNGMLYFAADDGIHGAELWKSDGTDAGTVMVKDIYPGSVGGMPDYLTNVNGTLFFTASDGIGGVELWKSNGTADGTVMVKDIQSGIYSSGPRYLSNVNGVLYFAASSGNTEGYELWKSDGTADGTVLVKDIFPGSTSSGPQNLTNVDGTLFFAAQGSSTQGNELWKSDGTADGTVLVKDLYSGASKSSNPEYLMNVNGVLYFAANDGVNGNELWKSDGTATGTVLVKNIYPGTGKSSNPESLMNLNGTLYFAANDGVSGIELWASDGTAEGTVLLKDIYPGSNSSAVTSLANINGTLYFAADDGINGSELWTSDGTAAGTVLYADLCPGALGSTPIGFTDLGDSMFFSADDLSADRELCQAPLDKSSLLYVATEDWTPAGLTLTSGGDGKLHVYQTGTMIDALPPRDPAKVTGVSITGRNASDIMTYNYYYSFANLFIDRATLKIDSDNALDAGTIVKIDGGVLNLNDKTITMGDLTLAGGSILTGTLHANSYQVQSGTITAVLAGPGDLTKTGSGTVTVNLVNAPNVIVSMGTFNAGSIVCDTLVIGSPSSSSTVVPKKAGNSHNDISATAIAEHSLANAPKTDVIATTTSLGADNVAPPQCEITDEANTAVNPAISVLDTTDAPVIVPAAEPIIYQVISLPKITSTLQISEISKLQTSKLLIACHSLKGAFPSISHSLASLLNTSFNQPAFALSNLSTLAEPLKVSLDGQFTDSLARNKKLLSTALTTNKNALNLAMHSMAKDNRHNEVFEQLDSELFVSEHFRKQDKLVEKAIDAFHTKLTPLIE